MEIRRLSIQRPGCRIGLQGRNLAALFCLLCLALGVLAPVSGVFGREVPGYRGYVNDFASMMSPEMRTKLERALQSFDLSDSTQVAILTIDSLEGDAIEDFSIRVVDKWKVGQERKDNGVLFLVVKNDRKMRIEVGRGLEHVLTDLAAGRIIDNVVAPLFKKNQFDKGFEAGTAAIIQTTRGEYTAPSRPIGSNGYGDPPQFFKYLLFGTFLTILLSMGSIIRGAVGGGILFPLIVYFGMPELATWPVVLMTVPAGALIGLGFWFLFNHSPELGSGGSGRGGYYTGGGRIGGFGGGFGGFRGGGFGGGGASGGW